MENVLQHFRREEQPFIEQVVNMMREVEDRYAPKLTDFLDPRQQFIVDSIRRQYGDIDVASNGALDEVERKRLLLYPSYFVPTLEDFMMTVVEVQYPKKFVTLRHKDVLGSMMSLGIDRSKFGDIRVQDGSIQFVVATEVLDYVRANFTAIGKVKVHIEIVENPTNYFVQQEEWSSETLTVSSLRLDTVISAVFNISRQKSSSLIQSGKVKVNWTEKDQISLELQELDLISIRGLGRVKLLMIEGRTKKDKIRLQIGRLDVKN
ncbi:RNA-binding protein [Psychrobacillus sp. FJAT-21963]|uniref:YlmH family RNA-binding protein n=1 Tax=Psychrobacillus sp. FJAT-21963 TaxID=1712028 RepID=UPI0006FB746F|nr:RNA-binding protein [Psychrobacillus sp. FJAT-21963]KQL36538.1 RNA-binding protein [Psychrobacillus sp. FJAT-21963]